MFRRRGDAGMVTAEIAVAIPAVVVLLGGLIAVVAAVAAQLRCVDAAREGARAAARGDPQSAVVAIARQAAPAGASVTVSTSGDSVTVTVRASTRPIGGLVGTYTVSSSATGRLEPTTDDAETVPAAALGAVVSRENRAAVNGPSP